MDGWMHMCVVGRECWFSLLKVLARIAAAAAARGGRLRLQTQPATHTHTVTHTLVHKHTYAASIQQQKQMLPHQQQQLLPRELPWGGNAVASVGAPTEIDNLSDIKAQINKHTPRHCMLLAAAAAAGRRGDANKQLQAPCKATKHA